MRQQAALISLSNRRSPASGCCLDRLANSPFLICSSVTALINTCKSSRWRDGCEHSGLLFHQLDALQVPALLQLAELMANQWAMLLPLMKPLARPAAADNSISVAFRLVIWIVQDPLSPSKCLASVLNITRSVLWRPPLIGPYLQSESCRSTSVNSSPQPANSHRQASGQVDAHSNDECEFFEHNSFGRLPGAPVHDVQKGNRKMSMKYRASATCANNNVAGMCSSDLIINYLKRLGNISTFPREVGHQQPDR